MNHGEPHYAHSFEGRPISEWELLEDHLRMVAEGNGDFRGTAGFADAFGADEYGRLLGLWHDIGKYSDRFQAYLRASSAPDTSIEESCCRVDHSTAGAQHAARLGAIGRLLAYCIAGHHAGLPDDDDNQAGLRQRLEKRVEPYDAAPASLLTRSLPPAPALKPCAGRNRAAFAIGFFVRMLFSTLVDADFLATEWFMQPDRARSRGQDRAAPARLLAQLNDYLKRKCAAAPNTAVNAHRQTVLAACRTKADLPPGPFSLNVPTGGGKTLSSLAFALTHCVKYDLRRVVYAIPFTSIIEQTADVFREAMGDLAGDVLEYHSNLDTDDPAKQSERSRLAAENFDASLIVTTNVQLFESLFASRTSRCRKLHRLAKSVIILDEAQTLPPNLLAPTLAALDELVRNYGATVVLCSATQPAIEKRDRFPIGLEGVNAIIDEPKVLCDGLQRTRIERAGTLTNEDVAARLWDEHEVVCVVNSRRHAADLFKVLDDGDALHLSASMCAAHRKDVVDEIRRRLDPKGNEPCRVISTQVIEAGVDLDFPAVFRAVAGLDSVAQAAGRCNREGRLCNADGTPRLGRVVVFDYDAQSYRTQRIIETGAGHFREVAVDHADDLLSPQAIEAYFRLHYWLQGGDDGRGWDQGRDRRSVMECFSDPRHHQFRTAAERYQLIDDGQTSILVPYGHQGVSLIRTLEYMPDSVEPKTLRGFDRAAQRYTVGVRENVLRRLLDRGVLRERHGRYWLANSAAYHDRLGLTEEGVGLDPERSVI